MRCVTIPKSTPVPAEAIERLQRKFTDAKSREERERFWAGVQARKQPQKPIDYERLPV